MQQRCLQQAVWRRVKTRMLLLRVVMRALEVAVLLGCSTEQVRGWQRNHALSNRVLEVLIRSQQTSFCLQFEMSCQRSLMQRCVRRRLVDLMWRWTCVCCCEWLFEQQPAAAQPVDRHHHRWTSQTDPTRALVGAMQQLQQQLQALRARLGLQLSRTQSLQRALMAPAEPLQLSESCCAVACVS